MKDFKIGMLAILWLFSSPIIAQDQGIIIIGKEGCAPLTPELRFYYGQVPDGATVRINWGDGDRDEFVEGADFTGTSFGDPDNLFSITHDYVSDPANPQPCTYEIETSIVDGGMIIDESRQLQTVTVWDIDKETVNLALAPQLVRVCYGSEESVQFQDNSIWNCFNPNQTTNLNDEPRWIQWEYGVGDPANRIPDVSVGGSPQAFPFAGAVNQFAQPNAQSLVIEIPGTTTIADVGKVFEVRLNNWNQCNPYPGNDPQQIIGRIEIVDAPEVDFEARDVNGNTRAIFCLGDRINFRKLLPAGGDFDYFYQFYSDSVGSSVVGNADRARSNFTYEDPGVKLVTLTVTDQQATGNCSATDSIYIRMAPNDIARISALSTADSTVLPDTRFCLDEENIAVLWADSSSNNNIDPGWRWEFEDQLGNISQVPSGGGYSNTVLGPFTELYDTSGIYRVRLIKRDQANGCETQDEVRVVVHNQPNSVFSLNDQCFGDSVVLNNQSVLTSIDADFLDSAYWDFDYTGSFGFDRTSTFDDVYHLYPDTGSFTVAMIAKSSVGCFDTSFQNIDVFPLPIAAFSADTLSGCTDLEVSLENLGVGRQSDSLLQYRWYVDPGTGFVLDSVQRDTARFFRKVFINDQSADQVYRLYLEGESVNGCTSRSDTSEITVFPAPKIGFTDLDYDPFDQNCSPVNVNFEISPATMALNPDRFIWTIDRDSATISMEELPGSDSDYLFTFVNDSAFLADFTVTLTAEKQDVCFRDSTVRVRVSPVPSASFTSELTAEDCSLTRWNIQAEERGLPSSWYQWSFSEEPSNANFLTFNDSFLAEYSQEASEYAVQISLQTRNNFNCVSAIESGEIVIPARVPRQIGLRVENAGICPPAGASFENISSGFGPTTEFYLLQRSGNQSPDTVRLQSGELNGAFSVFYDIPGSYQVTLVALEDDCRLDTTIQIDVYRTAEARFRTNLDSACAPVTPILVESSTNQSIIGTKTWTVVDREVGDRIYGPSGMLPSNLTLTNQTAVDKFYDFALQISTRDGCVSDTIKSIRVYPDATASFTADPKVQTLPNSTVTFSNTTNDGPFEYFWDFGNEEDSSLIRDPAPVTYGAAGEYEIVLEVASQHCESAARETVRIIPTEPVVDFSFSPASGCAPLTVQFENLTQFANPDTYQWNFGDGQGVSSAASPVYTYNRPGQYTISLRATNINGASDIEVKEEVITVYPRPEAVFGITPDTVFLPDEPVYATNLSINSDFYSWDFGDGNRYTVEEPVHVYQEVGRYSVGLIAESRNGCRDTLIQQLAVTVLEGGESIVPNVFTPGREGPNGGYAGHGGSNAGRNNIFIPRTEGVTNFNMLIYNRWGELLFESRDRNRGWDGYDQNGRLCPQDVYLYKLTLEYADGREEVKVGDVTLLR